MRLKPMVGNVGFPTEPEVLLPGDDGWTDPQVEWEKQLEKEARARRARRALKAKTPVISITITVPDDGTKKP
jgi:hypothetical protein